MVMRDSAEIFFVFFSEMTKVLEVQLQQFSIMSAWLVAAFRRVIVYNKQT